MKTFTDAAGRTWSISLNLGTALKVKDALGVDLLQPEQGEPPLLTRLGTDELLLGQVLCALLGDQFEVHKVTEADVRAGFDGSNPPVLSERSESMHGALSGPSPEPSASTPGH